MNVVSKSVAKQSYCKAVQLCGKKTQFKIKLESGKKAFCGKLCLHTSK